MTENNCPYCNFDEYDILAKMILLSCYLNPTPVQRTLCSYSITSCGVIFEITDKERKSMMSLLEQARNELQLRYQPSGFHVGFNDGEVFQEKSEHLHIHIIPRYEGKVLKLDARWGIEE